MVNTRACCLVDTSDLLPLCNNTSNALTLVAIRLSGATAILSLLATSGNITGCLHELLPTTLTLLQTNGRTELLVNEKLRAGNANATQHVQDHWKKLDIVDRAAKSIVTKVTRAVIIRLSTRTALLTILENTHSRVEETSNLGLITFICVIGCNFYNRSPLNLIWRENAKLDTHDWLNFRRGRHLCGYVCSFLSREITSIFEAAIYSHLGRLGDIQQNLV
jgi:hypothetical protein